MKGKFVTGLCDSMKGRWDQLSTAQEKWEVLKSALCGTASSIVGHAHKREADWFKNSKAELRPPLKRGARCTLCGCGLDSRETRESL